MTTCDCAAGFTGTYCASDLNYCTPSTCLNGGICIEGYGTETSCFCVQGFNGTSCDVDLPFCGVDTCLNGGTCREGPGTLTTCDCAAGFTGANCGSDLNFCTNSTCLNGGTCIEKYGTETSCICTEDFRGPTCIVSIAGKFDFRKKLIASARFLFTSLIEMSLSKPHTAMTTLCMCVYACLLAHN